MIYNDIDVMFKAIKHFTQDKFILYNNPKELLLGFINTNSNNVYYIRLSHLKSSNDNFKKYLNICEYINLTFEEKIIKNLLE